MILFFFSFSNGTATGQTNVSGGIYADITWTLANSPYIVTSTVVVFPGHTLTIEPGVTVKFENNQQLEIRQASIIALGTSADSIIFTSNSSAPYPGIWSSVYLNGNVSSNFDYCSFSYGHYGIEGAITDMDTIFLNNSSIFNISYYGMQVFSAGHYVIDNCKIFNNQWGFFGSSKGGIFNYCSIFNNQYNGLDIYDDNVIIRNCTIECNGQYGIYNYNGSCLIENCNIENNQMGIISDGFTKISNCDFFHNSYGYSDGSSSHDTIMQSVFKYNGVGLSNRGGGYVNHSIFEYDSIGIRILGWAYKIFECNVMQHNINYAVKFDNPLNSTFMINNYWGTTDSATIESMIYDGYDNVSDGLLSFIPLNTVPCPNVGSSPFSIPDGCFIHKTGIESIFEKGEISIFPNPATSTVTFQLQNSLISKQNSQLLITDLLGRIVYKKTITILENTIDVSRWSTGMYFYQIISNGKKGVGKFVVER